MISPTTMDQQAAVLFCRESPQNPGSCSEPPAVQTRSPWAQAAAERRASPARKLAMLKRAGLFSGDLRGATVERACTLEDLRQAYRLVHQVYLKTGFIKAEAAGIRLRLYETTSETATFVAKVDGAVVAVLSVVGDSADLGLPSDEAFGPELDHRRAQGSRLCELTNQAVADEYRKSGLPTELMRCAIAHCLAAGYDESIATVSTSHFGFYDLIGFGQIGGERSYSQKVHDPVIALSLDLGAFRAAPSRHCEAAAFIHAHAVAENPYRTRVLEWAKQARRNFLTPGLLEQLFVAERNFLAECSFEELRILCRRWGQELFALVSGNWFLPDSGANAQTADEPGFAEQWLAAFSASGRKISARNPRSYRSRSFRRFRKQPLAVR